MQVRQQLTGLVTVSLLYLVAGAAYALPSLQIGPDGNPNWSYSANTGFSTNTWLFTGAAPFSFSAYANEPDPLVGGGSGVSPFDSGNATQFAYLVVSAVPKQADGTDVFDITVTNDTAIFFTSGFGAPPLEDSNDLPPHGIFDTYFEIYLFLFDGLIMDIGNTEPGSSDSAKGYVEDFTIDVNSIDVVVQGLHIDLFTVDGTGLYSPGQPARSDLVFASAPNSHDAEWHPTVPEPGALALVASGLLCLALVSRRRRRRLT